MALAIKDGSPALTASSIVLTLLLVTTWLATHRYQGLSQDARIYAVQALARINPSLRSDIYLQNTSQDQFTLFSPFYAFFVRSMGLANAALLLTIVFTGWFLTAAWDAARSLLGREKAWLAVAFLILTVGTYGAYHVFRFDEEYLTARLPAEALVATGIALFYRGHRHLALLCAAAALLVHPIMALPGLLLVIYLAVPKRISLALSALGISAVFAVAAIADLRVFERAPLLIVDGLWLDIVRERSQFLFLPYWHMHDWETTARCCLSLALSGFVLNLPSIRRLCFAATLVGMSGLLVALLAGSIGPVAVLLQGQAWRWMWITAFLSALLLGPTLIGAYRDESIGPMVAILLVAAWTVSELSPTLCLLGALGLWLFQPLLTKQAAIYLKWAALTTAILLAAFALYKLTREVAIPFVAGSASNVEDGMRSVSSLRFLGAGAVTILWYWSTRLKSAGAYGVAAVLLVLSGLLLRTAFDKAGSAGSAAQRAAFGDWQRAIPESSNVYVADGVDSSTFAWFALGRPSYLSLDQSAGVVFSRATALEIRRRSENLLPLMNEDWKLLTKLRASGGQPPKRLEIRPLTGEGLVSMCADPALDFIIAREDVGFDPVRHTLPGRWRNWNLYDCRHVRSAEHSA